MPKSRKDDEFTRTLDELVLRRHREGLTVSTIAGRLGVGVTAVRLALERATGRPYAGVRKSGKVKR